MTSDLAAPEDLARADFYAVLSRLFYGPPDAAFLAQLAGADELAAERPDAALPQAWNALCRAAGAADPDAVAQEYDDLFIGVGRPPVMLYGSFYLAGFMMEKPLAALRSELAALGFARRGGAGEPEDHIAALADVMRLLVGDAARLPGEREARQRRFFRTHLEPWYGRLCSELEVAPAANFYRRVGRFARAFLDLERESFEIDA